MSKSIKYLVVVFAINASFFNVFGQKAAPAAGNSGKLTNESDSIQYVLGAHFGRYIISNNFSITNPNLFKKGFDDIIGGKPLLIEVDSIAPLITTYQKKGQSVRGLEQEKALFDKVKLTPGIGVLPSGVCYSIMKASEGKRPTVADSVTLQLKGFYSDGKLFEDTYPKNTPYHTTPNGVILGIKEILQIMPVGSVWRVYIPSALAFGEKGVPDLIPPYSALIYEIELLNVKEEEKK